MSNKSKGSKVASSLPVPSMRRGVKGFYRDVVREMKHVNWPSGQETGRLTGVVLAVCFIIILMLLGATTLFGWVVTRIISGGA